MDMKSRVIPEDTGFKFNDHRRVLFNGSVPEDVKPEPPDPERFPPDLLYEQSQGGSCLVGVLIAVAMAWVFGAMCGYGFCELLNQSGVR